MNNDKAPNRSTHPSHALIKEALQIEPSKTPEHEVWCHLPLSEHIANIETLAGPERVGALEALIARLLKLLDGWEPKNSSGSIPAEYSPFTIGPSQSLYWDPLLHRNGAEDGYAPRWALYRTALRLTQILGEEYRAKNIPVARLVDRWPVLLDRLPGRQFKNNTEERVRPSEAKQAKLYPVRRTAFRTLDSLAVGARHLFRPGLSKRESVRSLLLRTYLSKIFPLQRHPQTLDVVRWAESLGDMAINSGASNTDPAIEGEDWRHRATTLPPLSHTTQEKWIDVMMLAIKSDHPNGLLNPSRWNSVAPDGYNIWDTVRGIVHDKISKRTSEKTYDLTSKQGQEDALEAIRIELRQALKTHLNL